MGKEPDRVKKARQDQLINELIYEIIAPDSFIRDLPPEKIIDALRRLKLEGLQDYQESLERQNIPPESHPDPADIWKLANILGQCAWEHFRKNAAEKFRLALVELFSESLGYAESISIQYGGGSQKEIEAALPTSDEVQYNVLRHSVVRMNQLPLKREENDWHLAEMGENMPMQLQAARLIFLGLPLWTYDHAGLCLQMQESIRPFLAKHEDPDAEAAFLADGAAEVVWAHIDGAIQTMLLILTNYAFLLCKQSAADKNEIEMVPEEAKQILASKEMFKEIADNLISRWIDSLPFDWRGPGRPAKTSVQISADAARLIDELREIAQKIISSKDGQVTWEKLASERKRPMSKLQSGESLRKEAAALGIHLRDIKPEEN